MIPHSSSSYRGPIPASIWAILVVAHERGGIYLQSDFARTYATEVALAASCGWLSTVDPEGHTYGNQWRITAPGLVALSNKEHLCSPS